VWQGQAQGYDPEVYYTPDVEVINNLIRNNGLQANIDDPEEWAKGDVMHPYYHPIVVWDNSIPKQIFMIHFWEKGVYGAVSFARLKKLQYVNCNYNQITEIDFTDCEALDCISCDRNNITRIELRGCKSFCSMYCRANKLTEIVFEIEPYRIEGSGQNVSITLYNNKNGVYSRTISLQEPIFDNPAICYQDGMIQSSNNSIVLTDFSVAPRGKDNYLGGTMHFIYSEELEKEPIPLHVYMNVIRKVLVVKYENEPIVVNMYNLHGQKVVSNSSKGNIEIDVSPLQSGVYIVSVFSEGRIIGNTKIVKW
jgi:hypothetical protein